MFKVTSDQFLGVAPILTDALGNCMTTANWQASGTKVATYQIAQLLMKPGYDFLITLPNLASYVGWTATLVLNASLPKQNADGTYTIHSMFDGRRLQFTHEQIFILIARLQPDIVIFSEGMWKSDHPVCQALPKSIMPFLPASELPTMDRLHGVSLSSDMLAHRKDYRALPCYIHGDIDLEKMAAWVSQGAQIIESNLAADDGCRGNVYDVENVISIQDARCAMQYERLAKECQCPTCKQQLTRAYFHHLFFNTPHLCQRFLTQHNAHFLCQWLDNELSK